MKRYPHLPPVSYLKEPTSTDTVLANEVEKPMYSSLEQQLLGLNSLFEAEFIYQSAPGKTTHSLPHLPAVLVEPRG